MHTSRAFVDAALARSRRLESVLPSIADERRAAATELSRDDIRARTAETWKYTSIEPFLSDAFAADVPLTASSGRAAPTLLTFRDAVAIEMLGARARTIPALPRGVRAHALADSRRATNPSLDVARHPLALVNTALLEDGLVLQVADGVDAGSIDLRFCSGDAAANVSRVRVELGAGSRLELIEQHAEDRPTNSVVDVTVGANAHLAHVRLLPRGAAPSWCLLSARVERDAAFELTGHALGAAPRRSDVHVQLVGTNARARLDLAGATFERNPAEKDRLDQHVTIEHVATDTTSRETVHSIASGSSELTFDGRIHIHAGAQRSDARLTNRNLLLDRKARINTKPELEIYANDVKCSHGATVGQLDPAQLFYLRTRGLDEATARGMLTRAFLTSALTERLRDAGVLDLYAGLFGS